MDVTFEEVFKIPLKTMTLSAVRPDSQRNCKWCLQFLVIVSGNAIYLLVSLYNVFFVDLKANDVTQAAKNGVVAFVIISVLFQYSILEWKKDFLASLFTTVKNDYTKVKELSYEDQKIVFYYAKQIIRVGHLWFVVTFIGSLVPILKNILIHAYYHHKGDFHLVPLYDFVYPKTINDKKDQMIVFITLYLLFLFYSAYSSLNYCTFSPLGPSFMLHASGRLEILTKRIDNLFSENPPVEDVMEQLRSIALELQEIYEFVNVLQDTFRVAYEIVLKVTSILFPITAYEVIEAFRDGELSIEFVVFLFGSIFIAYSPCYYSELLMEKGESLQTALYCCGWERTYDRNIRTMILLLLQRSSRPIAIRTIFRTLCLDTLADFCRQSYAIFNLINAVYN